MKKHLYAFILVALLSAPVSASAARLDTSFGSQGTVITKSGYPVSERAYATGFYSGTVTAMVEDHDGRILAGGNAGDKALVARYLPNGELDPSFGVGGKVELPEISGQSGVDFVFPRVRGMFELPNANIQLAIEAPYWFRGLKAPGTALTRLLPDGSIDESFGDSDSGRYFDLGYRIRDLERGPGGKLLMSGWNTSFSVSREFRPGLIVRFKKDGKRDGSFGPKSKHVSSGTFQLFPRKWPHYSGISKVEALKSGKILGGGYSRNRFYVTRLTRKGLPDKSFGAQNGGKTIVPLKRKGKTCFCSAGTGMAVDRHGRILLTGYSGAPSGGQKTLVVLRFKKNGKLNRRFGRKGRVFTKVSDYITARRIVVHPSGRILVTAWKGPRPQSKFALFAYNSKGRPIKGFFRKGKYVDRIGKVSTAEEILVDSKGRIVVGGGTDLDDDASFVLKRFVLDKKTPRCFGRTATITGSDSHDRIVGTPGPDVIAALGGNDRIIGRGGSDRICGGSGLDRITAGGGDDRLSGNSGKDRIWGQSGDDRLFGDSGADLLVGSKGNDRAFGKGGHDRIFGAKGDDKLFGGGARDLVTGGPGRDYVRGGQGADRVYGGRGKDNVSQ